MTYRDAQLTMGVQSVFETAVTTNRWLAYLGNSGFDLQPGDAESEELTADVDASSQFYRPVVAAAGSIEFETKAKGMGFLHKAALGGSVSTLVAGTTYQQNFTPLAAGASPYLDALTVQFVQKLIDNTDDVNTFIGATIASIEWKLDNAGVLTCTVEMDSRNMVTNIAKASASTAARNRFTFAGFSAYTGALTEPTTTALPTCATQLTAVKSFSIKVENNLVTDDYRGDATGMKGQQAVQDQTVTGEIELDYNAQAQAIRNAWINGNTATGLLLKLDTGVALSTGTEPLLFAMPDIRATGAPTPNRDGKFPTLKVPFKAWKPDASTAKLFVCARTSDATI